MRAYVRCGGNGGVVGASCARSIGRCPGEWATRAAAGPLRCVSRPAARRGVGCVAGARVGTRTWGHTRPHGHVGTHMSGDTRRETHVGAATSGHARRSLPGGTHASGGICRNPPVGSAVSGHTHRDEHVGARVGMHPSGPLCWDTHIGTHRSVAYARTHISRCTHRSAHVEPHRPALTVGCAWRFEHVGTERVCNKSIAATLAGLAINHPTRRANVAGHSAVVAKIRRSVSAQTRSAARRSTARASRRSAS